MTTRTLNFTTNGEYMTRILRDFIREGNYSATFKALASGYFPSDLFKDFFLFKYKFEGDTATDGDLSVVKDTETYDVEEMLMTSLRTVTKLETYELTEIFVKGGFKYLDKDIQEQLKCLFAIFTEDGLKELLRDKLLGYPIYDNISDVEEEWDRTNFNGVILQNGQFVKCGVQGHNELFPILYNLDLSNASCWTDDDKVIHISSGQINGTLGSHFRNYDLYHNETNLTENQVDSLMNNQEFLSWYGGTHRTMANVYLEYMEFKVNHGGKYGKLNWLRKFHTEILLPKFSKELIPDVVNCIRTSPKHSIAGLLTSKFNIGTDELVTKAIAEIKTEFEEFKDVKKNNELHWFYQEYIEGKNGVCNYMNGKFDYSCSTERGDIVLGKKGNVELSYKDGKQLEVICSTLSEELKQNIQLEFVISTDGIYVVQLKLFGSTDNPNYRGNLLVTKENTLFTGKSFYRTNTRNLKKEDVLIIDSDCESKELIGKKGLIVRDDVQFSHALALSFSLHIPSVYDVGDVEIPDVFRIDTYEDTGYILKKLVKNGK